MAVMLAGHTAATYTLDLYQEGKLLCFSEKRNNAERMRVLIFWSFFY